MFVHVQCFQTSFFFRTRPPVKNRILKFFISERILYGIKEKLGLQFCNHIIVGAASVHPETLSFFLNLDIPILELYGMTECTGIQTLNVVSESATEWKTESCGKSINGVKTKINCDSYGNQEVSDNCEVLHASGVVELGRQDRQMPTQLLIVAIELSIESSLVALVFQDRFWIFSLEIL